MGGYIDQAIERLKEFEGSVPWMYLDTVGKVTVGVGSMLPNVGVAGTLPFLSGERPTTPDEIAKEFTRVSGLAKGRTPGFYRKPGSPTLAEATINQRLREVLEGSEGYLREHVGKYEELPDGAKLALLDMVYNLGPGKLFQEYPKLIAAIERGNWADAARACLRRGPSPARNAWTREQFLQAAKRVSIQAEAASGQVAWKWFPVLVGVGAALAAILALVAAPASSEPNRRSGTRR